MTFTTYSISAQVGINTSTPTQTLDVNGNVRFRNVPENNILDNADRVVLLQSDGTAKKVTIESLQPTSKFSLDEIYSVTATNPIDRNIAENYPSSTIINNVDIQMTQSINIPANSDVLKCQQGLESFLLQVVTPIRQKFQQLLVHILRESRTIHLPRLQ